MTDTIDPGDLVSWRLSMLGDYYYPRHFGVVVEKITVGYHEKQNAYRVIDSDDRRRRVILARHITKECG